MSAGKIAAKKGSNLRHRKRVLSALLFLSPGLAIYSVLILYPTAQSLIYSLQDWDGMTPRWVGLANFSELLHDKLVWIGAANNLRVLALALIFQLPLAMTLAYMLSKKQRVASLFRFMYFIPGLVGAATMALLWGFVYQREGLLNALLKTLGLSHLIQPWLSKDGIVQWTVAFPGVYAGIGFFVIIFMAAISEIPDSLYEAASIDGANSWQQLVHITLPSVWGVYLMACVLAVTDALSAFVFPFILTNGGPLHRTETLTSYAVWQAFTNYRRGYGSAIAVFHFAIAIVATLLIRRLSRREHQESKAL
ncbi:MAG: sugar ABC transporter permease [Armatimonadota bacterium]|nr:sugar ABC transporter permease [Armatimonadota bacterium]